MFEENQKVVVMNASVPIEAAAPVPVTSAAPLQAHATILSYPAQKYEYKVFYGPGGYRRADAEPKSPYGDDLSRLKNSLERWLNEGWEIHYADNNFPGLGTIVVFRRAR